MRPYRYLECQNLETIQDKIYSYLLTLSHYDREISNWQSLSDLEMLTHVPELLEFFNEYDLIAKKIYVLQYSQSSNLHVDYNNINTIRMNFPVRLTNDTAVTEFYQLTNMKKIVAYSEHRVPYYLLSYSDKKLVDSYVLTKPVIIDSSFPHIVKIQGKLESVRVIISIEFTTEPYHLLEEKLVVD